MMLSSRFFIKQYYKWNISTQVGIGFNREGKKIIGRRLNGESMRLGLHLSRQDKLFSGKFYFVELFVRRDIIRARDFQQERNSVELSVGKDI
jgi:hypothetical protein